MAIGAIAVTCAETTSVRAEELPASTENRLEANDALVKVVSRNVSDLKVVATIDHARLAAVEEVAMPPSNVIIYSNPAITTALMKLNPRVGLDLSQKILVFEEAGKPAVAFPPSAYLAKRHGIADALGRYDSAIGLGLRGVDAGALSPVASEKLPANYGVLELVSDFPLGESITRLKDVVLKQGDTVWFGEIDFKAEAARSGVELPGATLILFGGPKPGGVAMAKFPKLGLDAFCQKLLVYEDSEGTVKVPFNDIKALAELHYGTSAKPHKLLNERLRQTFESAVKKKDGR